MRDLQVMLDSPQESLDVEYKNWLGGLASKDHISTLAKEVIALANFGGGYIVIGFEDKSSSLSEIAPEPGQLDAFLIDNVTSAINYYVTPAIQLEVRLVQQSGSSIQHPVLIVPPANRLPVWSIRNSPDNGETLKRNVLYTRRPGGQSSPPQTQDDWEKLLERLVLSRISQITDAVRDVILPLPLHEASPEASLIGWKNDSYEIWKDLLHDLPDKDERRLAVGHYSFSFKISGFEAKSLSAMLDFLSVELGGFRYGTPFHTRGGGDKRPSPGDGEIRCWLGNSENMIPEAGRPEKSTFWRMSLSGFGFSIFPMEEDSDSYCANRTPRPVGKSLDLVLPSYRLLSALRVIRLLGKYFGTPDSEYTLLLRYEGMAGRDLECHDIRRWVGRSHRASIDVMESTTGGTIESLSVNIQEAAYRALHPIYEKFDFYDFPRSIVADAANEMGL